MCEVHDRIVAAVEKLDGVERVRIEHGGPRGAARRFRRHPHLVAEVYGKAFQYPLKLRPKDKSRGYWLRYLNAIRHKIRELQEAPAPVIKQLPFKSNSPRKHNGVTPGMRCIKLPTEPPQKTRLSEHPFSSLAALRERLLRAAAQRTSE